MLGIRFLSVSVRATAACPCGEVGPKTEALLASRAACSLMELRSILGGSSLSDRFVPTSIAEAVKRDCLSVSVACFFWLSD